MKLWDLKSRISKRSQQPIKPAVKRPPIPELPKEEKLFPDAKEKAKPRSSSYRSRPNPRSVKTRSASSRGDRRSVPVRPVRLPETSQEPADPRHLPTRSRYPSAARDGSRSRSRRADRVFPWPRRRNQPLPPSVEDESKWQVVPPEQSSTVFVDITAYNSKYYYVLGDVLITGRLAYTGNETVLDALNFAGGLVPTAEPKDIQLVRPERDGKPSKVYKVDLEAIQQKGEVATNYQIFPGDRLVVGRNEVVKKTVEIDRLNAPIQSLTGMYTPRSVHASDIAIRHRGRPERAPEGVRRFLGQGTRAPGWCQVRRANLARGSHPQDETAAEPISAAASFPVARPSLHVHSGSGWPRVSGANGRARRPTKKTEHMATPASRAGMGSG